MNKAKLLNELKSEIEKCRRCPLYKTRTNIVFGEGDVNAKVIFAAEGPGYWEDRKGRPFVGKAGQVLNGLLESVGIKRKDVYITNLVKDRPVTPALENRAPSPEEIKACSPYLERQIEIIKPEIICTLGNYSTAFILEKYRLRDKIQGISKIHGKVFQVKSLFTSLKIIPLYHPAVATYNPNMKKVLLEDFKILKHL